MVWIVVLSWDCICRDLQHQISKLDRLKYLKILVSTATKPSKVSPSKITLWHESFNIPPPTPPVFHGNESHLDGRRRNGIRTTPLSHLVFFVASAASTGPTRWPELKTFHIPTCSKKKTAFQNNPGPTFSSPYLLVVSALFKPCKSPYLSAALIHPSNPIQSNPSNPEKMYCFLMDNFARLEIVLKSRWRTCGIFISSVFCTSAHYWTPQQTQGMIMYHNCIFTPSIHPVNHPSKIH